MSLEARAVHFDMLCHAWQDDAGLPADKGKLAHILGIAARDLKRLWPDVETCWTVNGTVLFNSRLEHEREKQKRKQRAGKTGGKSKAKAKQNGTKSEAEGQAKAKLQSLETRDQREKRPLDFFESKEAEDLADLEAKEAEGSLTPLEAHSLRGYRDEARFGL